MQACWPRQSSDDARRENAKLDVSNRGKRHGPNARQVPADGSQPVSFYHRLAAVSVWRRQDLQISGAAVFRQCSPPDLHRRRYRTGRRRAADARTVHLSGGVHPVRRNGLCLFPRTHVQGRRRCAGIPPLLNGGTAAILFCFACLFLATAGGGPYSVDAIVARSADSASSPSVIASAREAIHSAKADWIASARSLSSGAHSRDPLAPRNDRGAQ